MPKHRVLPLSPKRLSQTADQQKKGWLKATPPNYLKHNSYEKEYSRSLKDLDLVYEDNPDTIPSLEQLYAMLLETLEKLPESHRQVFVKTYFEGRKQEEIAAEMNISVKSVGRYKQKTIDFLRGEFKECLPLLLFILGCGGS